MKVAIFDLLNQAVMNPPFKRFCKTLQLKDNPELITAYCFHHSTGNTWPEINQGMKDVGILDMEIYLHGTTLFMIMETTEDFDHDRDMARLAEMPRQAEWAEFMSNFQVTEPDSPKAARWTEMERISSLERQLGEL